MGELVALETQNVGNDVNTPEEDCVDFVAATTASLGVPSPSISIVKSFDESPRSVSEEKKERKGDLLEEEELLKALQLSVENNDDSDLKKPESVIPEEVQGHTGVENNNAIKLSETASPTKVVSDNDSDSKRTESVIPEEVQEHNDAENEKFLKLSETESKITVENENDSDLKMLESVIPEEVQVGTGDQNDKALKLSETESTTTVQKDNDSDLKKAESVIPEDLKVHTGAENDESCSQKASTNDDANNGMNNSNDEITFQTVPAQAVCSSSQGDNDRPQGQIGPQSENHESKDGITNDVLVKSEKVNEHLDESSKGKDIITPVDESKTLTSSVDESEPMYEGEEHIQETSTASFENGEPMYEGEVALAERVDKVGSSADVAKGKDGISPRQGELIRNFLKNSASQLTIYGLFCLQEGLKERELCVFFRNNHFNTMFKFEGELYLLATDQGYISQPDLVWEKLNEVNGDSVFMTGNFKEFNAENQESHPHTWDEQNALANTADYLASIDNTAQENTGFNSDLQLAIALQQQEFEQQQQQQQPPPPRNVPPPNTIGESGLVTGPQHVQPSRPKSSSSSSSSKQESKSSKEKCTVM